MTALAPGGFGQGSSVVPVASAHDVVMNSQPADGSTVGSFPTQIVLEFSAIPLDSFNTVAVSNSDTHEVYFTTEPTFDQQFAVIRVPEGIDPGPGNYTIGFQITSSDGHATRGKTTFTVAGPSASVGDDATAAPDSGFPLWGWVVCGVLVLLVLAGVGIALTRT
ncbi:MAG: copper resistance protein CopC [Corynebacterium sp.]|nr:copper resistance protein CopC [Corynebacterium sp.]